eukprot:TRINITY_DN58_c0_g1_i1.p3 TRINITY_DN58_c0_g1~~TRINITY_DN58_c0_g1_i1.p3  ORF type:complete len:127 (+),score=15.10 TRINITY_DN58_c0_g1_i1:381-761(+)
MVEHLERADVSTATRMVTGLAIVPTLVEETDASTADTPDIWLETAESERAATRTADHEALDEDLDPDPDRREEDPEARRGRERRLPEDDRLLPERDLPLPEDRPFEVPDLRRRDHLPRGPKTGTRR